MALYSEIINILSNSNNVESNNILDSSNLNENLSKINSLIHSSISFNNIIDISNNILSTLYYIPHINIENNHLFLSTKERLLLEETKAQEKINKTYDLLSNIPSTALEELKNSGISIMNNIIDKIENQLFNYTGIKPIEIYFKAQKGFSLYNAWRNKKIIKNNKNISIEQYLKNNYQNIKDNINDSFSIDTSIEDSEDEKYQLIDWLNDQNDSIYNSFLITILKDKAKDIKNYFSQYTDLNLISLENIALDYKDITNLYDELNISDAESISLENIENSNINNIISNLNNIKNNISNINELTSNYNSLSAYTNNININNYFNINSNYNNGNINISIRMLKSPYTYNYVLINALKALNLFDNATIKQIILDSQQGWINTHLSNSYKAIDRTIYSIDFIRDENNENLIDSSIATNNTNTQKILNNVYQLSNGKQISELLSNSINLFFSFKPIFDLLSSLIINYRTNKALELNNALLNINYQEVNQYLNKGYSKVNLDQQNFYIIRTNSLLDIIKTTLNISNLNNNSILLNEEQTNEFIDILSSNNYNIDNIERNKETIVYINKKDISNNINLDEITSDSNNIIYNQYLNTILYIDSSLDELDSQILRALRDSNKNKEKENNTLEDLLDSLIEETDEIDGEQMINFVDICEEEKEVNINNYINIYSSETDIQYELQNNNIENIISNSINTSSYNNYISDIDDAIESFSNIKINSNINLLNNVKTTNNYAIIEFGDKCKTAPEVTYSLNIKNNDSINKESIIGTCLQEGKNKTIKSIFKYGNVIDISLFENCNRYIVVKDYELTEDKDVDIQDINNETVKFQMANYLFELVSNNIKYALIPNYILKSYLYYNEYSLDSSIDPQFTHKGLDTYQKEYNYIYNNLSNKIQGYFDNIEQLKSNFIDDYHNTEKVGNSIIDDRINAMYTQYNNHNSNKNKNGFISCYEYYKEIANKTVYNQVSSAAITNYYKEAYEELNQPDEKDIYGTEYYNILTNIYNTRVLYNQKYICDFYSKVIKDYNFSSLYDILNSNFKKIPTIEELKTWIKENNLISTVIIQKYNVGTHSYYTENLTDFYLKQFIQSYLSYREYIKTNNISDKIISKIQLENISSEQLAKEEYSLLNSFWIKIIDLCKNEYNFQNILEEYRNKFNYSNIAEWPDPIEIEVKGIKYNLYEFSYIKEFNDIKENKENADQVKSMLDNYSSISNFNDTEIDLSNAENDFNNHDLDNSLSEEDYNITPIKLNYWKKYFAYATIATLAHDYWAPGILLPHGRTINLPAIYIPFVCNYLKSYNLTIINGLSIRGTHIDPLCLYINMGNQNISVASAIMQPMNILKNTINNQIFNLENSIPNIVNYYLSQLKNDNENMFKENQELNIKISQLKSLTFPKYELAKKDIIKENKITNINQHIIRLETLLNNETNNKE